MYVPHFIRFSSKIHLNKITIHVFICTRIIKYKYNDCHTYIYSKCNIFLHVQLITLSCDFFKYQYLYQYLYITGIHKSIILIRDIHPKSFCGRLISVHYHKWTLSIYCSQMKRITIIHYSYSI